MEPESSLPSKKWANARSYRKGFSSDIKKGKAHETYNNSVKKRSENLKSGWDHVNRKPRSKRKRCSGFWPDRVYKELKMSEIETAEESHQVKRTKPALSDSQCLEDGVRKLRREKQNIANQLVELEEGEILPSPSPSPENHLSDKNELEVIYTETERQTILIKSKNLDGEIPTHNVSDVLLNETEHSNSSGGTAIVVESDSDSDIVELIGQKSAISTKSPYVENQTNDMLLDSVLRPSEAAMPAETVQLSLPIEVGNISGNREGRVTPESHLSPNVSAVESIPIPLNHPPVSCVPSSTQHGLLNTPASTGIQSLEVQALMQPLLEETIQISIPSIIDLQLPQLSTQMSGNIFHDPGHRTNAQDLRAMTTASSSTSMNDLFHANLVIPQRTPLYTCHDPLQNEMERLKKRHEEEIKMHEAMILGMKSKRDKDIEEVLKKYNILFQDAEAALQHKIQDFHANVQKVHFSQFVAAAALLKHTDPEKALTADIRRDASDFVNHLAQNPTQISSDRLDRHPPVIAPMVSVINQPSQVPARPCSGGPVYCSTNSYQNGLESRVAAPHLRASLSQSSRPRFHFPVLNNGEFIQPLPRYSHNN